MRFLPLCRRDDPRAEDPLLRVVREQYHAQPVAMPRGDIDLLGVLVESGENQFKPWGPLTKLVTGKTSLVDSVGPSPRQIQPKLSGVRSSAFDFDVGIEILAAILRVFGLPVPGVRAAFDRSRTLSFKFSRVTQRVYSAAVIGEALNGRRLRRGNIATKAIEEKGSALIIDSVLESPDFEVTVKQRSKWHAGFDYGVLAEMVTPELGISLERTGDRELSFRADQPAVFAFTALRLEVGDLGRFTTITLGPSKVVVLGISTGRQILYSSEPSGLELDQMSSTAAEAIYGDDGALVAVDVRAGPLVVNASPVELRDQPSLLVPDDDAPA